ncbi:GNAT family N-acetyltransferase, partial [Micromonospora noduli]|uniref:GNAT family N-acetyltransferase n=1 Tax=Micromonospora noduli TaxID=709876 RepID=UPI001FC93BF9
MTIAARPTWTTRASRPDHPDAVLLLREYMTEMVVRYHRRSALPGEVDAALAELPSDDLTTPSGLLLLAHHGTELAGCAGLRWQPGCAGLRWQPGWAELTRVFIRSEHRGAGGGAVLLAAAGGTT